MAIVKLILDYMKFYFTGQALELNEVHHGHQLEKGQEQQGKKNLNPE